MKKIIYIALLFWCGILAAKDTPPREARLFILSGQSNMARLDPDLSFTPTLKKAFPNDEITVIKDAMGGQPIRRWYKKAAPEKGKRGNAIGDLYDRLISNVKAGSANTHFSTVTFVWMQGETDANQRHGDRYATELRGVINQLKHDLGRDDLYVVVGRISDSGLKYPKLRSEWEKMRNAQVQIAETDSRSAWVDTDDLNGEKDVLHYTDEGYKTFGERLAQSAVTLLKKK
ncbi:MAG: sialate O-acetylesterase [Methylovulum sp.]|nr:sialate O-acetylesterase [Methylovulum sp.]